MKDRDQAPQDTPIATRPARRPPPRLARSLGPHLRRLAEKSGAMDPRLAAAWPEIAGEEIARLCRPMRIVKYGRAQALEVSVRSNAAAMRVQYAQEALLGRVRQRLGMPRLTKIVFRDGQAPRTWETRRVVADPPPPPSPPPGSTPTDDNLKAALDQMRQTIHRRER